MSRKIIKIDENRCDGCGDCIPTCHEGALRIIDGKARLISDLFCDGLGACVGHCPTGALTIEEREAEPYNEYKVMDYIAKGGYNVIKAHLEHLLEHRENEYYREAVEYLRVHEIPLPTIKAQESPACGCAGSAEQTFAPQNMEEEESAGVSHLRHWPIQLHLVSPNAQYYRNSDLLLAADCCGFSYPDFHKDFLKGKSLAIACPKLDTNKQIYLDKLITMINESNLRSITVLIMQVPCCGGLLQLAKLAADSSERDIEIKAVVIGLRGEVLKESSPL